MKTLKLNVRAWVCMVAWLAGVVLSVPAAETGQGFGGGIGADRRVQPQDIIIINVYGEEDMSVERRVQASGKIEYWLLGELNVLGKTPGELGEEIRTKLAADYLVRPEVDVMIKEYASRTISVIGQVVKPGLYSLPGEQRWRIIDAIGQAGGLTSTAKKGSIELFRDGKKQTFSFEAVKQMTDPEKTVWLQPGDTINVPESWF